MGIPGPPGPPGPPGTYKNPVCTIIFYCVHIDIIMYVIRADVQTVNCERFPRAGRHGRLRIELCGSGQRHRADTGELLPSQELDSLQN